jgi:hypothetical protein
MLIKDFGQSSHETPYSSADRWTPPRVVLIVFGALLVMLPLYYPTSNAMTAPGALSPTSREAGCREVPAAVDLLGALEGLPPIPGHGVRVCR